MSQNGAFTIGIGANIGDATKKLNALNKQLAQLQKPAKDYAKAMARFQDLSGITKARDGLRSMTTHALGAAESLTKIIAPLGLISGAASLAGMYKLVSVWGEFGTQLRNTSQRLNMTSQSLMSWQNGARLAGTTADAMTSGLKSLGDTMQDAIAGRAPEAMMMFNAMGVDIRKATLEAKSAEDVLPQLADKIASIKNPTIQAQLATKLFGASAEAMLPFLKKGSQGIAEYRAMAVKYGLINDDSAAAADRFRFSQTKLTLAVEGLGNSITEKVAPVISPLLDNMSDWISLNREWIAGKISEYVKQFADWIKSIKWDDVWNGMKEWIHWGKEIVDMLGGATETAKLFLGLWVIGKLAPTLFGIRAVTLAIADLTMGLKLADTAAGGIGGKGLLTTLMMLKAYGENKDMGAVGTPGENEKAPDQPFSWLNPGSWLSGNHKAGSSPFDKAGSSTTTSTNIPTAGRALLDTISDGESSGNYAAHFGGSDITDFSKHPGTMAPIPGRPGMFSSAAGRYQFTKDTWDEEAKKLGLKDFSPASLWIGVE